MKRENLEALLLFDGDNIRYATGLYDYGWRTYMRYCIVPVSSDPIMFDTVGTDLEFTSENASWLRENLEPAIVWKLAPADDVTMENRFAQGIIKALRKRGLKIDSCGSDIPDGMVIRSLSKVGIKVDDATDAVSKARMIKSRDELEILKMVCGFVDNAFWFAKNEFVKPGVRESQVKGKISQYLIGECCCEAYVGNVSTGGNTNPYYRGEHTDKVIRQGDLAILDIVARYQGYWADFVRSWLVDATPTRKMREVYQQCHDSLQQAMKAARPNSTTADVARRLPTDKIAGVREETMKSSGLLNAGHGVGLTSHERPWITRTYSLNHKERIDPNMYFAIETYVRRQDGIEAARLEENFVVTENGPITYSLFPFEDELLL
ncbi:MAG: aminopeptidase P family protein [Nitrososphaerota archaeon]|nr:aminopeptidase P family protein [Nitrososphaerota archaeon]